MKKLKKLKYDENFIKRFRYLLETIITLPIGAIAAFIFEQRIKWALGALIIFFIIFIIYCIIIVVQENKVSVLSIMNEGLKDGRYEDVIKFGSAMSPTLFTSNKNLDRVKLGRLLFEACKKLSQTEYSARDDIIIASGGSHKTVKQIKIELLLDDLGWSLYLIDSNNSEATTNIQEAIKLSRLEIKRLKNKKNISSVDINKQIEIYMRLIMRGYRHLTGIYYSKQKTLDLASNYERVTQFILSEGRILSVGGVCSYRLCDKNCGMMCNKNNQKVDCILNNIKTVYFSNENAPNIIELSEFVDIYRIKLNENDLIEDMNNFKLLSLEVKEKIIKEQCYAWSRNIVKWLHKNIHSSWDSSFTVSFEMKDKPFVSDDERICKISEATAFARLYFYGARACEMSDFSDFDIVISTNLIKKEQQRYLTLINEISLIDLNRQFLMDYDIHKVPTSNITDNVSIEIAIEHIKQTRDACKGLRVDLFARNTALLMKAILIQYNLNIRYNMGDESTEKYRIETVKKLKDEVKNLYNEVVNYEHCENEDVKSVRNSVIAELKLAYREIKHWKFVTASKDIKATEIEKAKSTKHPTYVDMPSLRVVDTIKERWGLL